MKSFRWHRFSDPEFLGGIQPELLKRLLSPYRTFLSNEGVDLGDDDPDYEGLVAAFTAPSSLPPADMLEALSYIDEVAIDANHDHLADAWYQGEGRKDGQELSVADLAVLLWLEDRPAIERLYAEQYMTHQSRFDWYVIRTRDIPKPAELNVELVEAMNADLQQRFDKLNMGSVRVYDFRDGEDLCFVVRHGGAVERGLKDVNGEAKAYTHRVLKHGVLIYSPSTGELAVHGKGVRPIKAYVEVVGHHLFGDKGILVPADAPGKFTLDPLVGKDTYDLDVSQTDEISSASFCELRWRYRTAGNHKECHTASDVFSSLRFNSMRVPHGVHMQAAVICYTTSASLRARRVRIRPPHSASYERDSDASFIEPWLLHNELMNSRFKAVGVTEHSFWTRYEKHHAMVATLDEWKRAFADSFPLLEPLLVGTRRNEDWIVLDGEHEPRRVVTHADGERVAVMVEPGGDRRPVTKTDTASYRIQMAELAKRFSMVLGFTLETEQIDEVPTLLKVGADCPIAGVRSPIMLFCPSDERSLQQAINCIVSHKMVECILLIPTRRCLSGDIFRTAEEKGVIVAVLDEILTPVTGSEFGSNHEWPAAITRLRERTVPSDQQRPIRFLTPPDATWSDVTLQFMDIGRERLSVRVKGVTGVFHFVEMGMKDGRSKGPDSQWELLKEFQDEPLGVYTWDSKNPDRKKQARKEKLSKCLRAFFGIEQDPIPYDKNEGGYRWLFTLRGHDWVG